MSLVISMMVPWLFPQPLTSKEAPKISHTTVIKAIKIASISALRMAVEDLNQQGIRCSLKENATPRAYFPNQTGMGHAPFVLELSAGKYDIGFYLSEDGKTYEARTDFWGGDIERLLGAKPGDPERAMQAKMGRLYQAYGIAAATEAARKQGKMVRRIQKENGVVALEITGFN